MSKTSSIDPAQPSSAPEPQPGGLAIDSLDDWCRAQIAQRGAALVVGDHAGAIEPGSDAAEYASHALPADLARSSHALPRVGRCSVRVPRHVAAGVRAYAERREMPAPLVLLAAWNILVFRHGDRDQQVVGTVVGGASGPAVWRTTTRLDGARTVEHALTEVGLELVRAYQEHAAERGPDIARWPATPFWFRWHHRPAPDADLLDEFAALARANRGVAPSVLLEYRFDEVEPLLALSYDATRYDPASMEWLLHRYELLLDGMVRDPGQAIAALPMTGAEERATALMRAPRPAHPAGMTIHGMFARRVADAPHATALVSGDREVSYEALDRMASATAQRLIELGVERGMRVGICMRRSVDMVAGLLAILKAGAAYVAFDPDYPRKRLDMLVEDAEIALLLVDHDFESADLEIPCLTPASAARPEARSPRVPCDPEDLAYLCYTSGTTGRPKAAMIPHRGVIRLLFGVDYARLGPRETLMHMAPLAFDASTFEIWGALLHGGRCVLYPPEPPTGPGIAAQIRAHGVTTMWLTSALFNAILDESPESLRELRQLLVGGEALSVAHVKRALATLPDTQLVNGYGPTECTTFACCHPIPRDLGDRSSIPIGKPIGDTQAYILDADQRPVPALVPGELYLAGAGLARGYWRRPDLTRQAFVPNPFAPGVAARMYKTGDRVRMLADGSIEFLGRIDTQVKVRGFRIELEEIEAVLRELPGVRDAAAAVSKNQVDAHILVAYVVTEPGVVLADVEHALGQRLPRYMMPGRLVALDQLPMTANGKLDRRALPEPSWSSEPAQATHVAARTPTEVAVARVWQEVLGAERVGMNDSFRELGGHSLLATQAIVRLREELGVDVPLRLVFEADTGAELAQAIDAHARADHAHEPGEIRPQPRDRPLPLSFSQERVWFIQEMNQQANAYNFQATLRFAGDLDIEVLRRAIDEIVHRHEILRTTFAATDGRPYQVIHAPQPAWFRVEDLRHLGRHEQEQAVQAWMQRELSAPFAMDRLPLVRWTLLRLAPDRNLLIQVEHHLVHDGWSFHVFLGELVALYRAYAAGQPSPLPPLPIQFADFALWQREWMRADVARRQLAYWKTRLEGAPPVWALPLDRPRPAKQSMKGAVLRLELDPALAEAARALARREDATLFEVMLSVYLCLIFRYTGEPDLCVGTGIANRSRRELEGLIGMVINTIALRVDVSGNPRFSELLARVKQVTREGYANQDIPFDQVVDVLKVKRSLAYSPIYQTTFSFHDAPMPDIDLPGLTLQIQEGLSNGSAKFDLNVIMMPRAEQSLRRGRDAGPRGITMLWEHSTDILDGDTVRRMVRHYKTLLRALAAEPSQHIAAVALMDAEERRAVHEAFARAPAPPAVTRLAHELVAERAAGAPGAVALRDGERAWTYRELCDRANRLARHLQSLGIGREHMVALCMDHCVERVVAQLAVLSAGAAFVPMDPAYPRERLAAMLEDCAARAVLTRGRDAANLSDVPVPVPIPVIDLDADRSEIDALSESALDVPASPHHLAYAIFTSGSTGRPKGVLIEHRSLAGLITWHLEAFQVTSTDRAALLAGPAFDASVWELWPYLVAGAQVVVTPPELRARAEGLRDWLLENQITVTFAPTPVAEQLVTLAWPERTPLRALLTGGDKLDRHLARPLPFTLYNNYGLTESTVVASCGPVAVAPEQTRAPSIGKPIAGTRLYVLDARMEPVPMGVAGELYIGGAGVARGYVGQPSMTAERFLCDPFTDEVGARMYRTGDRGRYLLGGDIEFMGRLDGQVQLRGLRVELGEIDAVLGRHPDIQAAATVMRQSPASGPYLVAYLASANPPPVTALRELLARWLPAYMIPARFVFLDELPMTRSGKLDVDRLPGSEDGEHAEQPAFEPPRTELEAAVSVIWSEVLGCERVGIHDDFFAIGGHSLVAARIIARIEQRLSVRLPLQALFDAPTVATLCALVEQAGRPAASEAALRREASPDELLERIDDMSEEEVEMLLQAMKREEGQI